MGILRSDRVSGLGGANAINGSVKFSHEQDALIVPPSSDFNLGTADYTIEAWVYPEHEGDSLMIYAVGDSDSTAKMGKFYYRSTKKFTYWCQSGVQITSSGTFDMGSWYHVALVNSSGTQTLYVNGVSQGTSTYSGFGGDAFLVEVGKNPSNTGQSFNGYISNLRVQKGKAEYTAAFTPPTTRLEKTPETVLLCCQSPGNVTQEATGKSLVIGKASGGDSGPVAARFVPDKGEDHGTTFADNTKFDTLSYMVPPGGRTDQRGRGRALIAGGTNGGGWGTKQNTISYIQIQSGGIAKDFGDLSSLRTKVTSVSSSTRAVFGGGSEGASANNAVDTMEYVTIATTGNVTAFGDALESNRRPVGGVSNNTRGLFAGGYISSPGSAEVDHITIATTGSVTDYGDLSVSGTPNEGSSNSTRGVYMGGGWGAQIEYVTIASTGSGADFGDVGNNRINAAGASSSTRALLAGGGTAENSITYIEFATLSGDSDFGDLTQGRRTLHGTSNGLRGIFCGGYTPDYNIIDYVNISTVGNARDFGDLTTALREPDACSDSHGGIS